VSELRDQIQQIISTEPVSLFMKGTPELVMCGNSDRALRALQAEGAPVTTVDVLPDPQIRQELSALSGWPTIPQVFIRGELVGGADIVEELHASGELRRRLDEALARTPLPLVRARALAAAYQSYLDVATRSTPRPQKGRP
jgi:monothiol glutaredoxin